jgi:hypothetical protein
MEDQGNNGTGRSFLNTPVKPEKGRMGQLVLENNIRLNALETAFQGERQVIQQTARVGAPGQGDNFDHFPLAAQILHQHAVIEEAAADKVQVPVEDQSDPH